MSAMTPKTMKKKPPALAANTGRIGRADDVLLVAPGAGELGVLVDDHEHAGARR